MKIPWREGERRLYPESMVLGIVAIPEGRQTTSHGEIQQPHQVVFPAEQTRRQRGAGSGKRMEIQQWPASGKSGGRLSRQEKT